VIPPPTRAGLEPLPVLPGYEMLRELGRGGMGVVYLARQENLGRLVAVKVIRTGVWASGAERHRFAHEARLVAQLDHPGLVACYTIGEDRGCPYFVMEYVEGGSLAEHLDGRPWPVEDAVRLVEQLARATQHAHDRGVVHRDLKPENVLLADGGREASVGEPGPRSTPPPGSGRVPKIADFGLAKELQAGGSGSGTIVGTPAYMAPEQASGRTREIGPATDVHALGAILYELLTGRPPFAGRSVVETLSLVRDGEPVPPSRLRPEVDAELEAICLRCLAKRPGQRYPAAAGLADALAAFKSPGGARSSRQRRVRSAVRGASCLTCAVIVTACLSWPWRSTVGVREGRGGSAESEVANIDVSPNPPRREFWDRALIERPKGDVPGNSVSAEGKLPAFPKRPGAESPIKHSGPILETGARHATCDVVAFTPSGDELLTAGDDKVVRQWKVDAAGAIGEAGRVLRWPIYRERRGGIHAMALSPDARHVAVTGFGVKNGLVMVLDRKSGEVVHVLDDRLSAAVNWAIAWSPDGKFIVFGNECGDVFRWEPAAKADALKCFAGKSDDKSNRVRLLAFTDATHLLGVAQDGKVWLRDVEAPGHAPAAPIATLEGREHQKVCAAAFSRASKRLAACQDYRPGRVLWMDLSGALAGGKPGAAKAHYLVVPEHKQTRRHAWSLAFDARGDKLAAGTRDAEEGEGVRFSEVTGGAVFVYSLAGPTPQFLGSKTGLDCGYAVDALAFRPGADDQLAAAGGPNHEVRLWSYNKPAAPISEVRSPGSCLWSVGVDAKGEYLAWREQPNRRPAHANDRGAGPWRYFKLDRSLLAARAAAADPKAAALLSRFTDASRRRADLLLAPRAEDARTQQKRQDEIAALGRQITEMNVQLRWLLPGLNRKWKTTSPSDLRKILPDGAVFLDLLSYTHLQLDPKKPGWAGVTRTPSYLAFVVSRDQVHWMDLGEAAAIERAVSLWRTALTTTEIPVSADLPAKVQQLVWAKVRPLFPKGTKVVYIAPDLALARVPWAALPGNRPGTLVLEEYAVACVPHGSFLIDRLSPQPARPAGRDRFLVVGGVGYGDEPSPLPDKAVANLRRGEPPTTRGKKLAWRPLTGATWEATAVAALAARRRLPTTSLTKSDASAERVLAELPKARYAHLATHGFFADPSFRSVLQLDPGLFEVRGLERVGAGALSPMVLSGLVLAGANRPATPGRGLVTGEHLVDRDLSGLDLAVLSACETGLGDVAGGEGVFGLQRAFHLAGCRDVVATLWKVDDAATAALMNEFYAQLWDRKQPPLEALRRAQLLLYRSDPKDYARLAARGFGEGDKDLDGLPVRKSPPASGGGAHPALWAAFTLSGPGLPAAVGGPPAP
jgi:serine/threonine protein kinase/CHAT domain-containing protein/WD40 repeat protein